MIEVYTTNKSFAVVVPDNEKLQLQEEQLHLERREALFASQEQRSAEGSTAWSAKQALRDRCGDAVNTLLTLL